MASNQLNAGAASFTPGGPSPTAMPASMHESFTETSFNDFVDMVDTIEQEMDSEGANESFSAPTGNSGVGVSGLPAHMVKHANEFWFPESRNCTCCKGFKHGCQCAPSHGGVCASCFSSPPPAMTSLQAAGVPPASHGGGHAPPPQQQQQQPYGSAPRQQQLCKFYRSPGGCRFGDKCRFLHA